MARPCEGNTDEDDDEGEGGGEAAKSKSDEGAVVPKEEGKTQGKAKGGKGKAMGKATGKVKAEGGADADARDKQKAAAEAAAEAMPPPPAVKRVRRCYHEANLGYCVFRKDRKQRGSANFNHFDPPSAPSYGAMLWSRISSSRSTALPHCCALQQATMAEL